MAEQKSRIYSLPEVTEINDDMYLMLDASATGARRFNLKTFYDKVDGVQASADAANAAATAATTATTATNSATQRAEVAIAAMGDISEQVVPLMTPDVRGGAKLGDGLALSDGVLSVSMSGLNATDMSDVIAEL